MTERCHWANSHPLLQEYHDNEWGHPVYDDQTLYEMLVLESFSTGLSWLIILKKRDAFRKAFDFFDIDKVANYNETKVEELLQNKDIIRSKSKIKYTISNTKIFKDIQKEFGSFSNYLWSYTNHQIIYIDQDIPTSNSISDQLSADLKNRGMKYFGTITAFSYLQAVGILNCHEPYCFKHENRFTLKKV